MKSSNVDRAELPRTSAARRRAAPGLTWFTGPLLALLLLAAHVPSAQAALLSRDLDSDGLVDAWYEPTLDFTFLEYRHSRWYYGAYTDPADPSSLVVRHHDVLRYDDAVAWVESLTYGGFTDWRLPTVSLSCSSWAPCLAGEYPALRDLIYLGDGNAVWHWTGITNAFNSDRAWAYDPTFGWATRSLHKPTMWRYHAVRTGDVLPASPASVPEPPALLLMLAGFAALGVARIRRSQRRGVAAVAAA